MLKNDFISAEKLMEIKGTLEIRCKDEKYFEYIEKWSICRKLISNYGK